MNNAPPKEGAFFGSNRLFSNSRNGASTCTCTAIYASVCVDAGLAFIVKCDSGHGALLCASAATDALVFVYLICHIGHLQIYFTYL